MKGKEPGRGERAMHQGAGTFRMAACVEMLRCPVRLCDNQTHFPTGASIPLPHQKKAVFIKEHKSSSSCKIWMKSGSWSKSPITTSLIASPKSPAARQPFTGVTPQCPKPDRASLRVKR